MAAREESESNPGGDWIADGGSDWIKDAGEDGGAMNGITMAVEGFGGAVAAAAAVGPVGATGSGTRTAWPIRLLLLLLLQDPKHQYWLQQPPQRFFCS